MRRVWLIWQYQILDWTHYCETHNIYTKAHTAICYLFPSRGAYLFFANILYWWWESRTTVDSLIQHMPKFLNRVDASKNDASGSLNKSFLQLHMMNPGIVILEYVRAIREEEKSDNLKTTDNLLPASYLTGLWFACWTTRLEVVLDIWTFANIVLMWIIADWNALAKWSLT